MSKVVLITGGGSGIGKEIAILFAQHGHRVVVTDQNSESADHVAELIRSEGRDAISTTLDVQKTEHFSSALEFALDHFQSIDVLINNAGVFPTGRFLDHSKDSERAIDINYVGVLRGLQTFLPYFSDQGFGQVINLSSITAKVPLPSAAVYSSTKSAILTLSDALRVEYAQTDIAISCLLPGTVKTPLLRDYPYPRYPPPIEPDRVARAALKIVEGSKRKNVYVPWHMKPLTILWDWIPLSLLILVGKAIGLTIPQESKEVRKHQ